MQKVKAITQLNTILTKTQFTTREIEQGKKLLALKKNHPRLFLEISKGCIAVRTFKELNDSAINNSGSILEYINEMNRKTLFCKYYLQEDNKVCIEARFIKIENESELVKILKVLKHDVQQLLKETKATKKYLNT